MICYKDKTFCSSDVEEHTCGREMAQEEKRDAERMNLPVAYGEFCTELNQYNDMNRKPDYDLQAAINYHLEIKVEDIVSVLAQIPGEADGPDWSWLIELKDGKFALIQGGCDYTGWDCQSDATIRFADTAEEAAKLAEDYYDYRVQVAEQLLKQLKGEQPYALYIEPPKAK